MTRLMALLALWLTFNPLHSPAAYADDVNRAAYSFRMGCDLLLNDAHGVVSCGADIGSSYLVVSASKAKNDIRLRLFREVFPPTPKRLPGVRAALHEYELRLVAEATVEGSIEAIDTAAVSFDLLQESGGKMKKSLDGSVKITLRFATCLHGYAKETDGGFVEKSDLHQAGKRKEKLVDLPDFAGLVPSLIRSIHSGHLDQAIRCNDQFIASLDDHDGSGVRFGAEAKSKEDRKQITHGSRNSSTGQPEPKR